jgi:hypothetical protein
MAHILRCFDPINKVDVTAAFGIHFSKGNQKQPKNLKTESAAPGALVRDADGLIP